MFCSFHVSRAESKLEIQQAAGGKVNATSLLLISNRLIDAFFRRLERKQGLRRDFLTHMVGKVESGEMEKEELTAHSSTLT